MSNIDDDLYLMTVSKIQRLQNEYNELDKQHTIEYNESMRELFKIKEIIRSEEKILKNLEKRKLKKNV
jgi:DNA replication initiation complex subunit (GINS family)